MERETQTSSLLDRSPFPGLPGLTLEKILFGLLIVLTIVTRLYNLGQRVMSHDESLHTYFAWEFYQGRGYQHDPMMHGPLQFHLLALTYFLFGVNDFTARLPHAIASILTVLALWQWRRYLGRPGALIAAFLMLISPYMLYYGRYARNEALVGLFGVLMLYAILRYLESGRPAYLYLLTAATVLHFTAKETAFIYTAQALLFLGVYFIARLSRRAWTSPLALQTFLLLLAISVLSIGGALGLALYAKHQPATVESPLAEGAAREAALPILIALAVLIAGGAIIVLVKGLGWDAIRAERSFDLLMLLGTLVLPQLTAFVVKAVGWDPLNYTFLWTGWENWRQLFSQGLVRLAICLIPMLLLSILLGLWWNKSLWLKNAALFYAIFITLYTALFTHGEGFFSGIIGSLGYWLSQQGVNRGSQPWYYYILVQIPVYEFLPALGIWLAAWLGLRGQRPRLLPVESPTDEMVEATGEGDHTFSLLFWWSLSSVIAFSIAGEKMPWLTVHITLPMILLSGWGLGQLVERLDWRALQHGRGWLTIGLLIILLSSLAGTVLAWNGPIRPFAGKDLDSLRVTASFLLSLLAALGSAAGLGYLLKSWDTRQFLRLGTLLFFGLLAVLTGRAAFRAAYIEYDNATEYLVYAHGARGIKDIMEQAEEISRRTTGGYDLRIAYDASPPDTGVSWPFVWYLRDYPKAMGFAEPSRSLRDSPFIIVDEKNFLKIEPVVADDYYRFDYIRMVWPNQDYFNLIPRRDPTQPFFSESRCQNFLHVLWKDRDFSRLCNYLTDPRLRAAIFQIWLNRDYRLYAEVTGQNTFAPNTWEPSDKMRLYIRKDLAAQIWNYGVAAPITPGEPVVDPYEAGMIVLEADRILGSEGSAPGQFNAPRGIAIAPDGSLYVADSRNHRIQHFSAEGQFLGAWGSFSGQAVGQIDLNQFNEPWGVAVSPDGRWVYVADTWNHRIVRFTADGTPVNAWGYPNFGQTSDPYGFWGPRGLAVDRQGRVYVTDTGNKRVVIFDAEGQYLSQFGQLGMEPGQFDEPVGIALNAQGNVYVADTWNSRVQSFQPLADGLTFLPLIQWPIAGWYGQSLDNKPYLAIGPDGDVFVTDPEMYRVLEFSPQGEFIRGWGNYGSDPAGFGLAAAVAVDAQGHVWVSDAGNHRLMRFTLPPKALPSPTPTATMIPLATCQIPAEHTAVDLYACPDATCVSVGQIPGGETLTLLPLPASEGWLPARWNDLLGWIPGEACLPQP